MKKSGVLYPYTWQQEPGCLESDAEFGVPNSCSLQQQLESSGVWEDSYRLFSCFPYLVESYCGLSSREHLGRWT